MNDNFEYEGDFSYKDSEMYYPTYEDMIYVHLHGNIPWSSWDGLEASSDDWIETWEFIQKL